jgi:pimeloyl-ACP methyl ester carboxylesterase
MDESLLQPRAQFVRLPHRGGEMAYLEYGPQDRPVDIIFSHANSTNALAYRSVIAPLARHYRILAPDFRGHGRSALPTEVDTWPVFPGFRDDLRAFLDAAVQQPVVLAGHSMGAATSMMVAAAEPARVRSLALFEMPRTSAPQTAANWDTPFAQATLRRRHTFASRDEAFDALHGRKMFATWSDEQLRDYVTAGLRDTETGEVTLSCSPTWEALTYAFFNFDIAAEAAALRTPATVIYADIPDAPTPTALAGHPWVNLEIIPGATHFLPMERPALVQEAIRASVEAA